METKAVVEAYFDSWPNQRWDQMRECLADRIEFNGIEHDADVFTKGCASGVAWKKVTLIESVICGDKAALLYDGVDTASGTKMRVGEFLTVDDGKIREIRAAIMVLD
jgi:ketosteroid isomerase-like protein